MEELNKRYGGFWQSILHLLASKSILRTLHREKLNVQKAVELVQNLNNLKSHRVAQVRSGWDTSDLDILIRQVERAVKGHERYTMHYCRDA